MRNIPKYPYIILDLSKVEDMFDVLGKVHGQMKSRMLCKKKREEFTNALYRMANENNEIFWERYN